MGGEVSIDLTIKMAPVFEHRSHFDMLLSFVEHLLSVRREMVDPLSVRSAVFGGVKTNLFFDVILVVNVPC
jgi:hypothetical protein